MYTAIITTPHHAFALMNISWTTMPTARERDSEHAPGLLKAENRVAREDPEAAEDEQHDAPELEIREQDLRKEVPRFRQRGDAFDDVKRAGDEEEHPGERRPARARRRPRGCGSLLHRPSPVWSSYPPTGSSGRQARCVH